MTATIQKKPPKEYEKDIKVTSTTDVVNLDEVKEIRNAMQENMLLIGLDRGNNIRTLRLIGIGTNAFIQIDSKDILRTALMSRSQLTYRFEKH